MTNQRMCQTWILGLVLAVQSCASTKNQQHNTENLHAEEQMDDRYEGESPAANVPMAMQQKLSHMQGILEGILLSDHEQVEGNARSLIQISQSAEWMTHESVAYFNFSDDFRTRCEELEAAARVRGHEAMVSAYNRLTQSCIDCHTYLRSERIKNDAPGRVTLLDPQRDDRTKTRAY